jgi:NADH dehydrogenase/NADH oxidase (H2O2-forming)
LEKHDVLVIGGGPAAITIAKNIQNKRDIGVIRPEDHSMIYCAMPYVIENLLPYEKTLKEDKIVTETGAALIRDTAAEVDFENKIVKTLKGDKYGYNELVIAVGASPILPPIDGVELDNVSTFKSEEDLEMILDIVNSGLDSAAVVGAGAIGIELAQALNERGVKTNLIDMMPTILPNMLDPEMSKELESELRESGINIHLDKKVVQLKGENEVEEIVLNDGETLKANLVIFSVGMKANVEFLSDTNLEIGRDGILVNNLLETNIEDVYALGDCVQFESGITGDITQGKLATNAVPMGRIMANNLLGDNRSYKGFYNGSATKVGKYFVGGSGLTEKKAAEDYDIVTGYAEFTTAFPIMPFAKKVKMKIIVDRKTREVLGGQVVSGEPVTDKIDKITMAVQYGIKVDDLLGFSYSSQPYQSFYPAHNLLVKSAEEVVKKLDK